MKKNIPFKYLLVDAETGEVLAKVDPWYVENITAQEYVYYWDDDFYEE